MGRAVLRHVLAQKNTTSECWIECFYNNVLGPNGTSMLLKHTSLNFGIPLREGPLQRRRPPGTSRSCTSRRVGAPV